MMLPESTRAIRAASALLAGFGVSLACGSLGSYACTDDAHCDLAGQPGVCEPNGACSYPDDACPSGRRFSDHAPGGLAGQCTDEAPLPGSSSGSGPTGPVGSSTAGPMPTDTSDDTPVDPTTSGSSSGVPLDGSTGGEPAGWHRAITLAGHPQGPLSDVPVRVRLATPAFDFASVSDPGLLRVYGADQTTLLPHEIELWAPDEAELWVPAPVVDTGPTSIWLRYAPDDPGPAPDPAAVWGPDALGVWHLHNGLVDASASGHDGLDMGAVAGAGQIAGGHDYDESGWDELPLMGSAGAGTVELWFRGPTSQMGVISMLLHASSTPGADGFGPDPEYYVGIGTGSGVPLAHLHGYPLDPMDPHTVVNAEGPWLDDQWHHVVASWDITSNLAQIWVDGVAGEQDTSNPPVPYDFTEWVRLGGVPNDNRRWNGSLDEVRFYEVPWTHERALIDYAAQQSDFASVGPEQPLP